MKCIYCKFEIYDETESCPSCGNSLKIIEIDWQVIYGHYLRQEKNLIDFFEYVPLVESHYNLFSPKLFDIYFQIGAGIEQQLNYIYKYLFSNSKKILKNW